MLVCTHEVHCLYAVCCGVYLQEHEREMNYTGKHEHNISNSDRHIIT